MEISIKNILSHHFFKYTHFINMIEINGIKESASHSEIFLMKMAKTLGQIIFYR